MARIRRHFFTQINRSVPLTAYHLRWLLGLGLAIVMLCSYAQPSAISEPQLRAGIIVAILRYTQWPAEFEDDQLTICSLGMSPGFQVLTTSGSNISIQGKHLLFKPLHASSELSTCSVVIAGKDIKPPLLKDLKKNTTLSICDTCAYPDSHAVALFINNKHIRFSVNLGPTHDAGVSFSSAMLELAAGVE